MGVIPFSLDIFPYHVFHKEKWNTGITRSHAISPPRDYVLYILIYCIKSMCSVFTEPFLVGSIVAID